ncbi:MAG: NAD(P)H-dependent oxidoreductase subunit E [Firmicutes bacterium]|nr:NAD(P)H-dependent oxidoreductase subunit E [Bacillota bacterium]
MASNCKGCAEFEANKKALDEVIEKYKNTQGPLIPALHEAQQIYGYLPFEVQRQVAEGLDIPLAEVYGVVSFYTGFTTKPKGKYRINVCLGTACYVKGAESVLDKFKTVLGLNEGDCTEDRKFSLDACRCIGACGLAPAVMINDDVYGNVTPDNVELF